MAAAEQRVSAAARQRVVQGLKSNSRRQLQRSRSGCVRAAHKSVLSRSDDAFKVYMQAGGQYYNEPPIEMPAKHCA
jgi:hypothetical protein